VKPVDGPTTVCAQRRDHDHPGHADVPAGTRGVVATAGTSGNGVLGADGACEQPATLLTGAYPLMFRARADPVRGVDCRLERHPCRASVSRNRRHGRMPEVPRRFAVPARQHARRQRERLCVICHNSASSDQNNRVTMGVDASEAYDGLVGQTYELQDVPAQAACGGPRRELAGHHLPDSRIFAWAPEGVTPPNWNTGAACRYAGGTVVFGADPASNSVVPGPQPVPPDLSRAANDCAACHVEDFGTMVDQTKGVATTLDAGVLPWTNQLDDVLQGANTAACTSCHQGAPSVGHANQNGWIPTTFRTGGRQSSTQRSELTIE